MKSKYTELSLILMAVKVFQLKLQLNKNILPPACLKNTEKLLLFVQ